MVVVGSGDDFEGGVVGGEADIAGANVRDANPTGSAVDELSSAGIETVVVLVAKTPPGCALTALAAAGTVVK